MNIFDFIFGNTYSTAVFILLEISMALFTLWSWMKYKHRDFLWLFVLWSTLLVVKFFAYLINKFLLPTLKPNIYLDILFWFSTLRGGIIWTVFFLMFLIVIVKWSISWTPKRGMVFSRLMSPKGIFVIFAAALAANAAFFAYLTQVLLK